MTQNLQTVCDNFIKNRDIIKSVFKFENAHFLAICASYLASKGIIADAAKLKEQNKLFDEQAGIFSAFRGNPHLPVLMILYADSGDEYKYSDIEEIYKKLKKEFAGTAHLALAAAMISDMTTPELADRIAERAKVIYKLMSKEHPFLTGVDDYLYAILMAFSNKPDHALSEDMEECYEILREKYSSSNYSQCVSQIFALTDGNNAEKCQKLNDLFDMLRENGKKYSKYWELSVLAALSLLNNDTKKLCDDIIEVDSFLEGQAGYGTFGMPKTTRLMHAALLVSCEYKSQMLIHQSAASSVIAMVAAQQAALCTVIAAQAAASTAVY